jgi:hypothetical protein
MDAVVIGTFLAVGGTFAILVFFTYKFIQIINKKDD